MFYYYIFKNGKQIDWTILHEVCYKSFKFSEDVVIIRGDEILQCRTPCRKCGKLLDEKAAQKFLAKRELEKPLRQLGCLKIHRESAKKFSLFCGKESLLKNVDFEEIKSYVLTNFKPTAKILKEFEEKLFSKLMNAK